MSGGKGGETTSKTEIPKWAEDATKRNLNRAEQVQKIGPMTNYLPDVAAFTPGQEAAMQNNADAASAFGFSAPVDAMANMPQAQTFAGGIQGYSSAPLYEDALARGREEQPGYYQAYDNLYTNPSSTSGGGNTYQGPNVQAPVFGGGMPGSANGAGGFSPAMPGIGIPGGFSPNVPDIDELMRNLRIER